MATPEQTKEGQLRGRELPPPEVLQPTLDAALPAYVPRPGNLLGNFKGAASDVLVVLAQKWFDKFKTYHPGVTLTIAPPYAGSLGAIELVKAISISCSYRANSSPTTSPVSRPGTVTTH